MPFNLQDFSNPVSCKECGLDITLKAQIWYEKHSYALCSLCDEKRCYKRFHPDDTNMTNFISDFSPPI